MVLTTDCTNVDMYRRNKAQIGLGVSPLEFDTNIVVIIREDLATWQKLNVTAFTISGIAGTENIVGENYVDATVSICLFVLRIAIPTRLRSSALTDAT